jgi:hypothetical protein
MVLICFWCLFFVILECFRSLNSYIRITMVLSTQTEVHYIRILLLNHLFSFFTWKLFMFNIKLILVVSLLSFMVLLLNTSALIQKLYWSSFNLSALVIKWIQLECLGLCIVQLFFNNLCSVLILFSRAALVSLVSY